MQKKLARVYTVHVQSGTVYEYTLNRSCCTSYTWTLLCMPEAAVLHIIANLCSRIYPNGHKTWKYESQEKVLVQGCSPDIRSRGRQRSSWTDDIVEWTGLTTKQQDRLRIEIVGGESYALPTLHMEEGIEQQQWYIPKLSCKISGCPLLYQSVAMAAPGFRNL